MYLLDINDNAPHVFPPEVEMCEKPYPNVINITASDPDLTPNAGPFAFELANRPSDVRRNWTLSRLNGQYGTMCLSLSVLYLHSFNLSLSFCTCLKGRIHPKNKNQVIYRCSHSMPAEDYTMIISTVILSYSRRVRPASTADRLLGQRDLRGSHHDHRLWQPAHVQHILPES